MNERFYIDSDGDLIDRQTGDIILDGAGYDNYGQIKNLLDIMNALNENECSNKKVFETIDEFIAIIPKTMRNSSDETEKIVAMSRISILLLLKIVLLNDDEVV